MIGHDPVITTKPITVKHNEINTVVYASSDASPTVLALMFTLGARVFTLEMAGRQSKFLLLPLRLTV